MAERADSLSILQLGSGYCERCGKFENTLYMVTLSSGTQTDSMEMCRPCAMKLRKRVEKQNAKAIASGQTSGAAPVFVQKFPEPEPTQPRASATQPQKNGGSDSVKLIVALVILVVLIVAFAVLLILLGGKDKTGSADAAQEATQSDMANTIRIPDEIAQALRTSRSGYIAAGVSLTLGVKNDGTICGVDPAAIGKIKTDFVTSVNNKDKIFPPMYLQPQEFHIEGKTVLYIAVPCGNQVCRHRNRIYDRINDSDIDITDQPNAVYQLYARKNGSYFVNKVTGFGMDSLRPDLIARARNMANQQEKGHPWQSMDDEQLLRSAGLILEDAESHREGVTLAGILLFGKDSTIMSALPQHKTDAIFRVKNLDRYDDRDVIITNLLESYDRLITFGKKHLSDPFVLDGVQRVSARDNILREIVSNLLAHRDYASGYVAKFVIEKERMYTENANRPTGYGALQLSNFTPFAKNPAISKVFREIGLADELGSGMRNTYKYTKMYSGGAPEFIEGDMFRTMIPLGDVAVGVVGPEQELGGCSSQQKLDTEI